MGEIFSFLRNQHRFGKVTRTNKYFKDSTVPNAYPFLWDELEACEKRPCKVYLKSEIQEYITLHNPNPPKSNKRSNR